MDKLEVRAYVSALYESKKWKDRVKKMPDRQCYAIYRSTEERKRKARVKAREEAERKAKEEELGIKQLTLWDWLAYKEAAGI